VTVASGRARAGPDVHERASARQQGEPDLDEPLRLRPREEDARIDGEFDTPEAGAPEDVGDRLPLSAPPHQRPQGVELPRCQWPVVMQIELESAEPEDLAEQEFAIEARGRTALGGEVGAGQAEDVGDRLRPTGEGLSHRPRRPPRDAAGSSRPAAPR
jgi:hypothetical protein